MTLYLPIGCPGAGKSTLCRDALVHDVIDFDAIVSPDEMRKWLTGDRANQDCNRQAFEIVDIVVTTRLRRGLNVFLDATNLMPNADFIELARIYDHDVIAIKFDVDVETLRKRNETREHPVPPEVLDRMIARLAGLKISGADKVYSDKQFRDIYF